MTANVLAETIIFHVLMDYIYYRWLSQLERDGITGPYSIYNYDPKGKFTQRIDYTEDGLVMGGYDPDNPLNSF